MISFEHPQRLWLLLILPVMLVLSWRALACLSRRQRLTAILARSIVIVLLLMCLAGAQSVLTNQDLTVIFLLDRSHSIPAELHQAQERFVKEAASQAPPGDRVGIITFDGRSYVEQLPIKGGVFVETLPETTMADRTDLAGALRMALALFPDDAAKRVVILSDGNNNVGDVLAEVDAAAANNVGIDVVPIHYRHGEEIFVEKLVAPAAVKDGDLVLLRGIIHAQRPVRGSLVLEHDGRPVDLSDEQRRVQLQPGSNPIGVKLPVHGDGPHRFSMVFVPDLQSADTIVENNRATAFTFVGGSQRVLLLSTSLEDDAGLVAALQREKIDVTAVHVEQAGELELTTLLGYASVILSNVGADWFTDVQQEQLAAYVRDMGGGLIMTGGDEGFGAGGWIDTPVEEVMPVEFEIKHRQVVPRGALVIIMHSCEMPRGNYWGKVVAMKALDTISSKDYFGVLEYNHLIGVSWAVQLKEAVNKSAIKLAIEKMSNGDMPDFDQTLQMAAAALKERRDAAQRHIIIISDGDASAPNPSVIQGLVDAKITVSTVAIGYGFHAQEATLRSIASQTGGRFYAAKNPKNLPQIFVKESKVVRRPLLVEEPFTPHLSYAMSEVWAGLPLNLAVPQLGGLVMTSPRGGGLIEMPLVRKTADGDDPLLAHWQVGLGKTVAFTSGYWRHWGRNWVDWPNFSKLWAQIVRWTLGQGDQGRFDLGVNVDGTTGRVVVNALDEQGNFINMLNLTAHVSGPAGGGAEGISLQQVGPGRYEGQFEIDATGQYVVGLAQGDQIVGRTGVSVPYSPEYRELKANDALLQEIVDRSRGRIFDLDPAQQADIFRHDLRPTSWRRPVWSWILAWLLLPAFLLDVAVRRLASTVALSVLIEVLFVVVVLFGCQWIYSGGLKGVFVALGVVLLAELLGWLIRWRSIRPAIAYVTSSVTALAGAGQGSARSLEQLKGTRDRVRDERTGAGEAGPALRPIKGPQAAIDADRRQRFDVGEAQAARPAGDLRAELGAAPAAAPAGEAPAGEAEQTEAADTTGRLLQARRRIRHDRDVRPDSGPDEAGKQ